MKTITGTLTLGGFDVVVNLTIDGAETDGQPGIEAKTKVKPKAPAKPKAEAKPKPEALALTIDEVRNAAVKVAEKGDEFLAQVKATVSKYSKNGTPKVDTVPAEKLADLLQALEEIDAGDGGSDL